MPESEATTNMGERRNFGRHETDSFEPQCKMIGFSPGNETHLTAKKEVQQLEHSWGTDDDLTQLRLIH
jgi:hypothetical protein